MPIYVLRAKSDVGYDSFDGFVIRAANEAEARQIAQSVGGDEITKWTGQYTPREDVPFWTDEKHSSCELIEDAGYHDHYGYKTDGVILGSYNAG